MRTGPVAARRLLWRVRGRVEERFIKEGSTPPFQLIVPSNLLGLDKKMGRNEKKCRDRASGGGGVLHKAPATRQTGSLAAHVSGRRAVVGAIHELPLRISPNRGHHLMGSTRPGRAAFFPIPSWEGCRVAAGWVSRTDGPGTHPGLRPPLQGGDNKTFRGGGVTHERWGGAPGVRASSPQAAKMAALPGKEGGFRRAGMCLVGATPCGCPVPGWPGPPRQGAVHVLGGEGAWRSADRRQGRGETEPRPIYGSA